MQLKDTGKTRSAIVALCIAAVALQIGFAPQIEVMGGRINFMLILACIFILGGDTHRATIAGFFCGIAYDLTASVPVGLMSLILTVTCFISSGMFRGVQIGLNPNALRCTAIVMFVVNVLYGLLLFFIPHQRLVVFHVLKFQGRLEIQHRRLQHLLLRILGQVLLIAACRMEHRLNNRYRYSMCAQSLI